MVNHHLRSFMFHVHVYIYNNSNNNNSNNSNNNNYYNYYNYNNQSYIYMYMLLKMYNMIYYYCIHCIIYNNIISHQITTYHIRSYDINSPDCLAEISQGLPRQHAGAEKNLERWRSLSYIYIYIMYIYVYITWYFLASLGWRFFSWLKPAETGLGHRIQAPAPVSAARPWC